VTKDEELQELNRKLNSTMSLIRMMQGNTDPEWLKKLEQEWSQEIKDRIAELEKENCIK